MGIQPIGHNLASTNLYATSSVSQCRLDKMLTTAPPAFVMMLMYVQWAPQV